MNKLKIKPRLITIVLGLITFGLVYLVTACSQTQLLDSTARIPRVVTSILSDVKTFNFALNQESPNIFGLTYKGLVRENPLTGK
ncbi:MAG: hypothetical protein HC916_16840 [Coleofasciculaceae cyanobacterium SM2_1_6]|nr:hypothetical protein [Coleofasciculaceae cyanobacterium SM2_1_6]